MTIDYDSLLKQIVNSKKKNESDGFSKDVLKTNVIGNTIIGRLIPNLKDVDHSMIKYYHHGWTSKSNSDTKLFFLCPNSYGERCPICKLSISMWQSGDPVKKKMSEAIRRRINDMVNFYVISDAKHPENNGTLKILRYGKQIEDKFKMALEGDDVGVYGPRVWRLDGEGCNFRIKCEQNSDKKDSWPTYHNSGFLPPSTIEGMTPEKQKSIYESVFDLTKQFAHTPHQELEDALRKHFLSSDVVTVNGGSSMSTASNDEIPMNFAPVSTPKADAPTTQATPVAESKSATSTSTVDESDLDKMLEELQGKK